LHLNPDLRVGKNKGTIIPDLVAIRQETVVFFENKDRFVYADFEKVRRLRETNDYSFSISRLLGGRFVEKIFYGVGLPLSKSTFEKAYQNFSKIDFAVFVSSNENVETLMDPSSIFHPVS